jgi:hypothetical protein
MLKKRWYVGCVLLGMLAVGGGAQAQSAGPECSPGWSGGTSYFGVPNKVAYTIKVKSSHEQQLYNGSYVRSFSRTLQARASDGRTMQQMPQQCTRGEDGQPHLSYSVRVTDQKARTNLNWMVGNPWSMQEASLLHMNPPLPMKKLTPAEMEERRKLVTPQQPARSEYKNEDLGTKMIAGVEAHGQRFIRTIPMGEEGNDVPLVTTNETWTAKDLGIVVFAINDDPRSGKNTYEVEELTVGEPDAALFAPPEGYTIRDVTPVRDGVAATRIPAVGAQP